MYKILIFSVLLFFGLSISTPVDAQTLIEYQKQLQQQKRKEATAKQKNSSQRTNNKTATPKKPVQAQAKTGSVNAEKQKYDEACQKGTIAALKEYAKRYPNGKYISDVKERIDRIDETSLWKSAKEENTIAGYNRYLQQSKLRTYETEARNAIEDYQALNVWNFIKTSNDIEVIKKFIETYPSSSYKEQARRRLYELAGVKYYNQGNFSSAKTCFDIAGGKDSLLPVNQFIYDKCVEKRTVANCNETRTSENSQGRHAWNRIKNTDDIETVKEYIATHSNSPYKEQARRKLYELVGIFHYNQGNFTEAKMCFDIAGGKDSLQYKNQHLYGKCVNKSKRRRHKAEQNDDYRTYSYPYIRSNNSGLVLKSVTVSKNQTVLELKYRNENGIRGWCSIDRSSYISVNGNVLKMRKAKFIKTSPRKTYFHRYGEELIFKLYFPPLPTNATEFDFVEPTAENFPWAFFGVELSD